MKEKCSEKNAYPVCVKLFSRIAGCAEASLFEDENAAERILAYTEDTEYTRMTFSGTGVVVGDAKKLSISYSDPESNTLTDITYDIVTGVLTVERQGGISSTLEIAKGRNLNYKYETQLGVLDGRTYGNRIDVRSCGGDITLIADYISELCGTDAQRIKMRIDAYRSESSVKRRHND